MEKNPGFHYVYIPCDGSKIEERFFKGECQLESDGFQEEIKSHFAAGNAIVDHKMLKMGYFLSIFEQKKSSFCRLF